MCLNIYKYKCVDLNSEHIFVMYRYNACMWMLLSVRTWLFQQLAQGSGHRLRRYWSSRAGRQGRADHLQDHLHTQNVLVLSYFRASKGPPFTRPPRVMTNSCPYSTDLFSSHTDAEFSSIQSQRDQSPIPIDSFGFPVSIHTCNLCRHWCLAAVLPFFLPPVFCLLPLHN